MILTQQQLNDSLVALLNVRKVCPPYMQDFLNDMYNTGCRPSELTTLNKWRYFDSNYYELLPSKKNEPRYIPRIKMSSTLVALLENNNAKYCGLFERKMNYFFNMYYQYSKVTCGNKDISLYLFRHNYVKLLFQESNSESYVTKHMGWNNAAMASKYIYSIINYF